MGAEVVAENSYRFLMPQKFFRERQADSHNITVILPAYNEEVSIGIIVLLARPYADKVIVVDDGSLDRTAEVAANAGADVIVHPLNKGKGSAFKLALRLLIVQTS